MVLHRDDDDGGGDDGGGDALPGPSPLHRYYLPLHLDASNCLAQFQALLHCHLGCLFDLYFLWAEALRQ